MKFSMIAVQSPTQMLPLWWLCEGGPCFTLSTSSSLVCSSPLWPCWSSCSLPTRGRRSAWVSTERGGWIREMVLQKEQLKMREWKTVGASAVRFAGYSFLVKAWAYFTLLLQRLPVNITRKLSDGYAVLCTVSGGLRGREEETERRQRQRGRREDETKTKIEWVFLRVSERQMIVARSQVQHTKYTVPLSVSSSLLFTLQPTTPSCLMSASRHHGSAFSDCLHADGCGDYARHFRFCSPDRSVSFYPWTCV